MIRVLGSICIACFLFPIYLWLLKLGGYQWQLQLVPFEYKIEFALFPLPFVIILGLPWAYYLRAKGITHYLVVDGLAVVMACIPIIFYSTYLLTRQIFSESPDQLTWQLVQANWADYSFVLLYQGMYGLFFGTIIWLLGVYRNPWFQIQRAA